MTATPHHIGALRHVVEADLRRLGELEGRLKDAKGPQVEGVVKSIAEACDSLSAALTRLAKHVDTIRDEEPSRREKEYDRTPLIIAARVQSIIQSGLCECGRVIEPGAIEPAPEFQWAAAHKAKRATEHEKNCGRVISGAPATGGALWLLAAPPTEPDQSQPSLPDKGPIMEN